MTADPGFDPRLYLRVLQQRWPLFAIPVCLLTLIVGGTGLAKPPVYRATAFVVVRAEGEPAKGLAVATEITQQLGGVLQALKRPNEQKRVYELVKQQKPGLSEQAALDEFTKGLDVQTKEEGHEIIATLRFAGTPAGYASAVVNGFAAGFKLLGEQMVANSLDVSVSFVQQQLNTQRQRLADVEARQQTVLGRLSGNLGDLAALADSADLAKSVADRLREQRQRLDQLNAQIASAGAQAGYLHRQMAAMQPTLPAAQARESTLEERLTTQLADARSRRTALLGRYTAAHPEVQAVEREIADLERRLTSAKAEASRADRGREPNTAYEQLRRDLAPVEGQLAAAQAEKARVETSVQDLQRLSVDLPVMEKELARLKDEQTAVKQTYEQLLQRKQGLDVNQSFEEGHDSGRFEVRTATTPEKVSHRLLYLAAGLIAGLVLGCGFVLLAEYSDAAARGSVGGR